MDLEERNKDFLLSHVNTILAIGVVFLSVLLAVWFYTCSSYRILFMDMGIEIPILTNIATQIAGCWYVGLLPVLAEIPLWVYARRRLYPIYINAILLASIPSLALLFLMVMHLPLHKSLAY